MSYKLLKKNEMSYRVDLVVGVEELMSERVKN